MFGRKRGNYSAYGFTPVIFHIFTYSKLHSYYCKKRLKKWVALQNFLSLSAEHIFGDNIRLFRQSLAENHILPRMSLGFVGFFKLRLVTTVGISKEFWVRAKISYSSLQMLFYNSIICRFADWDFLAFYQPTPCKYLRCCKPTFIITLEKSLSQLTWAYIYIHMNKGTEQQKRLQYILKLK